MLVRLVLVSRVIMFMLLWAACVVVFVRVRVLVRMAVFGVSMLMLMVMLVRVLVFVFHKLPPPQGYAGASTPEPERFAPGNICPR